VDDIAAITKILTHRDAIIIAQEEIEYLDDLSLEGAIPDDVQVLERCGRKLFLRGVKIYS
jgi:hypothetical protein